MERAGGRVGFSGELGGIGLSDVFHNVAANRATGVLSVTDRGGERLVAFVDGRVRGCRPVVPRDLPVVERLAAWGVLDPESAHRHLARRRRSKRTPVGLLVDGGLCAVEDVVRAVTTLVRDEVCELLALEQGRFAFVERDADELAGSEVAALSEFCTPLEIEGLLMEAARRRDDGARIRRLVTSEDDVFVPLQGIDEVELPDDAVRAVADSLDGEASVGAIARGLGLSGFEVGRALLVLGDLELARPAGVDELVEVIDRAGDAAVAERLIRRALRLEPGRDELRERLVALLTEAGRADAAAAELALLGHAAAARGDLDVALRCYERAVACAPADVSLRERRLQLLARAGDDDEIVAALAELIGIYESVGTLERGREVLDAVAGGERRLSGREELVACRARLCEGLGHTAESARLWRRLGEAVVRRDEAAGLAHLRRALELDPEDDGLRSRIHDLATGRERRRRQRRQRLATVAAALSAATALGLVGVAEWRAERRLATALQTAVGHERDDRGLAALVALREVGAGLGWTQAGRRVPEVVERLVEVQLGTIRDALANGQFDRALELCTALEERVVRDDLRATCAVLRERAAQERSVFALLQRLERSDTTPTAAELAELAACTDGVWLDFHLAHIETVRQPAVRCSMLDALAAIDSPRAFAAVARLYVRVRDVASRQRLGDLLASASRHRAVGREADWAAVYPELDAMRDDLERGERAREALRLLRGE
ncbi:MAG: DUF4388 domain-containing protein [Planctomycetes bacterium]|nr:DUF4388 domain-containing protein [Planctomycetota bacterium]